MTDTPLKKYRLYLKGRPDQIIFVGRALDEIEPTWATYETTDTPPRHIIVRMTDVQVIEASDATP